MACHAAALELGRIAAEQIGHFRLAHLPVTPGRVVTDPRGTGSPVERWVLPDSFSSFHFISPGNCLCDREQHATRAACVPARLFQGGAARPRLSCREGRCRGTPGEAVRKMAVGHLENARVFPVVQNSAPRAFVSLACASGLCAVHHRWPQNRILTNSATALEARRFKSCASGRRKVSGPFSGEEKVDASSFGCVPYPPPRLRPYFASPSRTSWNVVGVMPDAGPERPGAFKKGS